MGFKALPLLVRNVSYGFATEINLWKFYTNISCICYTIRDVFRPAQGALKAAAGKLTFWPVAERKWLTFTIKTQIPPGNL